jgi:hypothetical protein
VIKTIKTSGITHQVNALASQQSNLHPMYQKKHWQETRDNLYLVMKCLSFYKLWEYDVSSAECHQELQTKTLPSILG